MNSKWRSDRNRTSVSLVKAELQVFTNYNFDCRDFYSFVICNQKLLDAAAGNSKYTWKKKRAAVAAPASTRSNCLTVRYCSSVISTKL